MYTYLQQFINYMAYNYVLYMTNSSCLVIKNDLSNILVLLVTSTTFLCQYKISFDLRIQSFSRSDKIKAYLVHHSLILGMKPRGAN